MLQESEGQERVTDKSFPPNDSSLYVTCGPSAALRSFEHPQHAAYPIKAHGPPDIPVQAHSDGSAGRRRAQTLAANKAPCLVKRQGCAAGGHRGTARHHATLQHATGRGCIAANAVRSEEMK